MKKQIILDGITFDYYIYSDGRCQNWKKISKQEVQRLSVMNVTE